LNGKLGAPYRFFYSSKNYVSGLTNIMAKVKRPDDATLGIYTLVETGDADFAGTYYFDMVATQLMPEGEYTVIIKELSTGNRQISKVTLVNEREDSTQSMPAEVIAKIESGQLAAKIIKDAPILSRLSEPLVSGFVSEKTDISAKIFNGAILAELRDDKIINGVLKEEC